MKAKYSKSYHSYQIEFSYDLVLIYNYFSKVSLILFRFNYAHLTSKTHHKDSRIADPTPRAN